MSIFKSYWPLESVGVATLKEEQCCGSLKLHLGNEDGALISMRQNVDAFYPLLADYAAIVSSASGCGVTVKDYGRLLAHDPNYAERCRCGSGSYC